MFYIHFFANIVHREFVVDEVKISFFFFSSVAPCMLIQSLFYCFNICAIYTFIYLYKLCIGWNSKIVM